MKNEVIIAISVNDGGVKVDVGVPEGRRGTQCRRKFCRNKEAAVDFGRKNKSEEDEDYEGFLYDNLD